jgi:hypothetical protein
VLQAVAVQRRRLDATKSHVSCTVSERIEYAVPGRRYVHCDIESLLSEETMSEGDILGKIIEIVASSGKWKVARLAFFWVSDDDLTRILLTIV